MRRLLLACLPLAVVPLAAHAQLTTRVDPKTGLDVPYRFPIKLDEPDRFSIDSPSREREPMINPLVAFGNCVVDRDLAGSIAYVRAGASGREAQGYKLVKPSAAACRSRAGGSWLLNDARIRLSAIADALRARRTD